MRTIERSTKFKADYKRVARSPHGASLGKLLEPVLAALLMDQTLDTSMKDHQLKGDWNGYRECHLKPDLLLIYRKEGSEVLKLARLGSHSQLFGR